MQRRSFLGALAALAASVYARSPGTAADPSRIALVVGNNAYPQSPLVNAANDARLMAQVLGEAGFKVDARVGAAATSMTQSVRDFGKAAASPEVKLALFYYAGHGAQVDWQNFLVPVDTKVASP